MIVAIVFSNHKAENGCFKGLPLRQPSSAIRPSGLQNTLLLDNLPCKQCLHVQQITQVPQTTCGVECCSSKVKDQCAESWTGCSPNACTAKRTLQGQSNGRLV